MSNVPLETRPLSPLQQGMLFHHLMEPGSGVDIEQLVLGLPEAVDIEALREAWARVAARHEVLRTGFRWAGVPEPVQDVHPVVAVPFRFEDWRALDAAALAARRREFLRDDRARGFALAEAPLMRLTLFRIAEEDYELCWSFHHIILDGRSFLIVLEEVFAWYEALRRGETVDLPPAPPYHAFLDWLAQRDPGADEAFWRDRLAGLTAPTALPMAFVSPDSSITSDRQAAEICQLSPDVTKGLRALTVSLGVTMNTALHGAWAMLLSRHSGESDVVFGATRACRRSSVPGAERTVGLFINSLPVRARVDESASLGAWLTTLRAEWNALRPHEHTPLNAVRGWTALPSGSSVFESLLVFENFLLEDTLQSLGGAWARRTVQLHEQTNYPLTLAVYGGERLTLKLEYDRSRFDHDTAERLIAQLEWLLGAMAAASVSTVIGDLAWVPPGQRSLVVEAWNRTTTSFERDSTIPAIFTAQAQATPDAVAVVHRNDALTYAQLDQCSDVLAHRLRSLGVGMGSPVGLLLSRGCRQIVAILAVLKANGCYLALDPSYPEERRAFMLADAGATVVVSEAGLMDLVPSGPGAPTLLNLDVHWSDEVARDRPQLPAGSPDDLAYIIYTSGSTGVPKGVEACHRGVIRLVRGASYAHFGPDEVVLSFAPLGFDASTFEIWGPLLNGGRLVVFPEEDTTLDSLGEVIAGYGITTMWLTAALFHQMVERNIEGLRPLQQLLAGGDVLSVPHVQRVLRELPACRLINGYGPTENTTFTCTYAPAASWAECDGTRPGATVPIGRPVSNTRVFILDSRRQPVPPGVVGRLYAGGDGLARGYHARPELTAERFIHDPFAGHPGARLYDTGDLAFWRPDGIVEFRGRADQQLKIRGFRVEPGEVEVALTQHEAVRDVCVIGREDTPGDKRLVAYVVLHQAMDGMPLLLRDYLRDRLPPYLVPSHFVILDGLPLTASGKVDRLRLPPPEPEPVRTREGFVAPRTETEAILAGIWSATLRVERVGVLDNFFELGGDSLLIIQVISRARQAGLGLSARDFVRQPTVAQLATLATRTLAPARSEAPALGVAPLSPAQRWFFKAEADELHHWNQAFLFSIPADFHQAAFDQALDQVIRHHDGLQMRFRRPGGWWEQEVQLPSAPIRCRVLDLTGLDATEHGEAIEAACLEAHRTIHIEHGPLVAAVLLQLGSEKGNRLFLAVHHLVIDGVSWRILLEDLESCYFAALRGEAAMLPDKTVSLKAWGEQLVALAEGGSFDTQEGYWRAQVSGNRFRLPRDVEVADPGREADTCTECFRLDASTTRALLTQVPKAYHTQINDVLLAALALVLTEWTGESDILLDAEGHGREDVVEGLDSSRTIGWFTALYPVRLEVPSEGGYGAVLKATKERLRAIPQKGFGFGVLREIRGTPGLSTPGELVFNYLGQFDAMVAASSLFGFAREGSGSWRGPRAVRRHLHELNALVLDGQLELRWSYLRQAYRSQTIRDRGAAFLTAIRGIVDHCASIGASRTPSDFPLAEVEQEWLDRMGEWALGLEDLYPLAPIQGLFLGFVGREQGDPGFEQWRYRLRGPVDPVALRSAWQGLLDRHSVLRTSFVEHPAGAPLQAVHSRVSLPWEELDWRAIPVSLQPGRLEAYLVEDRRRGFNAGEPPLMRLALIRLGDEAYELVWSNHHLLFDRWSWALALEEVRLRYMSQVEPGRALKLPPVVHYRDYIHWVLQQEPRAAEAFWRSHMASFAMPLEFSRIRPPTGEIPPEHEVVLSAGESTALRTAASRMHLSLSTLIQGAWALQLAHQFDRLDVVYGISVSGRPGAVAGIDQMLGLTINNIPVRTELRRQDLVEQWLGRLQATLADAQQFAHVSLDQIQAWTEVPWRYRLFDSLVVFQDAAAEEKMRGWLGPDIQIERVHSATHTRYPLSLMVTGSDRITFRVTYDTAHFLPEMIERGLSRLRTLLMAMAAGPEARVGDLLDALPAASRGEAGQAGPSPAVPAEGVAPRTALEWVISRIWGDLLGMGPVGVTDNFFALGGQSLVALQVITRTRETLRQDVTVRTLFAHPTVEGFAGALLSAEGRPGRLMRIAELVQQVEAMSEQDLMAATKAIVPQGD